MQKKMLLPNWAGIVLFFLVLLLLYIPHLSKLGIMVPWEMDRVSVAIELATDQSKEWMEVQHIESEGDVAPMPLWMTAIGFKLFGISETGGRMPSIILLFIAFAMTFWCISHLVSYRAAFFSVLVFALFPLTATEIFQMGGYGIPMCFIAISLAALALARWWKSAPVQSSGSRMSNPSIWRIAVLIIGVAALICGYFSIGGIIGLILPLATIVLTQLFTGDWRLFVPGKAKEFLKDEGLLSAVMSILLLAAFVILVIIILPVAASKESQFDLLAGGTPRLGAVPTIDYYIEHIAYGLYPWSTLLPAGMAALLFPNILAGKGNEKKASPARIFFAIANFLGFAAINFFAFRYVNIPYIVLMPAGIACGVLLFDLEQSKMSWKTIGMISCLLLLLFLRDIHLYPDSISELWVSQTLKEAYPVKTIDRGPFALFTLAFMVFLFFVFLQGSRKLKFLDWFSPEIGIIKAFRREYGKGWKIAFWCLLAAWLLAILNVVLLVSKVQIPPFNVYTSIARKVSYVLVLLPVIILVFDFCFRLVYNALASIKTYRVDLLTAAGFIFSFWFFNSYLPGVSKNLSPKEAIHFYKDNAKPGEELLTYRVKADIGKFYDIDSIRQVTSQTALFKEMDTQKRVFMLYGREDNPSLNLSYKEKRHEHIYVPEAGTWRFLLATNSPMPGVKQSNPIENIVRMVPPEPEYHVYANLDNKVEYLGYDLETKHDEDWAGALEHFTFTSYWHCTDRIPGSYKYFIHVDGFGLRLNGDHEPLEGLYPTRYWRAGDYLIDTFRMQVPIHFRAGDYTIYIGLFQGERRLPQVAGPSSGDDRIQGGILRVR